MVILQSFGFRVLGWREWGGVFFFLGGGRREWDWGGGGI